MAVYFRCFNPRILRQFYSLDEWVQLFAYQRIRGELGPQRWDYNVAHMSPYAGQPFNPPWWKEPADTDA